MASSISYRAKWARSLVRQKLSAEINLLQNRRQDERGNFRLPLEDIGPVAPHHLPPNPRLAKEGPPPQQGSLPEDSKVCIVGAGAAGLYIAMILDDLAIPNLTYEILEASDRVGGRMYTHEFSYAPHDYYDIGAMRFPQIGIMERTFKLFDLLGVPQIPYYYDYKSVNTPSRYNDIIYLPGDKPSPGNDVYKVSKANGGSVPDEVIRKGADKILDEAFAPYKQALKQNWDEGFAKLLEKDHYSTREYLRSPEGGGLDYFSIQWMETLDTSSGLFDQAFSESVIDSFDFDPPDGPNDPEQWTCILGGTSLVAKAMQKRIKGHVEINKRAHKIFIDRKNPNDANMYVQCSDEPKPRDPYVTVFNTTSLACLQRIDLTELDLHPSQKDALRCLHYDDSAKVAIKFSYPWWIKDCGITTGGVASTDLPLRTCVYPSYNLNDTGNAVLLCSYVWSQDALRTGSLVHAGSEKELLELMYDDLAKLHQRSFSGNKTLKQIRDLIAGAYVAHHAFSWSHDPYTSGAFALFGPNQFEELYPFLSRPTADSKFHIVGEASSAHHAWIVGALESAYSAVYKFLVRYKLDDAIKKLEKNWGEVDALETGRWGTVHLQVLLGMMKEGQHVRV